MLTRSNIDDIIKAARAVDKNVWEKDLAFLVLLDNFEDRTIAYRIAYGRPCSVDIDELLERSKFTALMDAARPFGVGVDKSETISREENQRELTKMLTEIDEAIAAKAIDKGQGLKMKMDIRVKLQDKFDMDDSDDTQRHIIVVPQKHDMICKYTNRECSAMPTKEACMEYYDLTEKKK